MVYIASAIEWDTDGMKADEDCGLPESVVIIDIPNSLDLEEIVDTVSDEISEVYGFCHQGFELEEIKADVRGYRTPWTKLAIMQYPGTES